MPSAFFHQVVRSIEPSGWQVTVVEDREVIETGFKARHGGITVVVQAHAPLQAVSVVAECAPRVEPPFRDRVAELLMRTNLQLNLGNFEMDCDDGRVFFRIANLFGDSEPSSAVVGGMVRLAVGEMDRLGGYLNGLIRTPPAELFGLDVARLMRREDLLPPEGGEME